MPPHEAEGAQQLLEDAAGERRGFGTAELVFLHREGYLVSIEARGVPVYDDGGTFRGFRGVNRDVTERREAQEALAEREERYRTLFTAMREGIAIYNVELDDRHRPADFVITEMNPAFERLLGVRRGDVIGKRASEIKGLLHGLAEGKYLEALVSPSEELTATEEDLVLPGQRRHLVVSALPVRRRQGGAMISDVTDKRRATETLARTSAYYRLLFDEFPLATWRSDPAGRIVYANKALRRLVGAEVGQGTSWSDLVHPEDLADYQRQFAAALSQRTMFSMKHRIQHKEEETYVEVLDEGKPLTDDEGEFIGYIGYLMRV
jgi:PAS domain S-box-containing protein